MKHLYLLLTVFFLSFLSQGFSQSVLTKMKARLDVQGNLQRSGITMTVINPSQAGILFSPDYALTQDESQEWLGTQLGLRPGTDLLLPDRIAINTMEVSVNKFRQFYKGIKVEHGVISTTQKRGKMAMMQMEYYSIDDNFKTTPTLTEAEALKKAIDFTGAYRYNWTDYTGNDPAYMLPRGELVIVRTYKDESEICLAYKFEINALYPFSKENVYVNAWDGTVVLNDPIVKHANPNNENHIANPEKAVVTGNHIIMAGKQYSFPDFSFNGVNKPGNNSLNTDRLADNFEATADTRFVGQQKFVTKDGSGVAGKPYRLRANYNNQNIITLNYKNKPYNHIIPYDDLAVDFLDNDNNWTAAEFDNTDRDNAALDAHFNMQIVSDYWLNVHNRNGWDNNNAEIKSYVHVKEALYIKQTGAYVGDRYFDNAFWNGSNMHFGDGTGNLAQSDSQTPLDVCAHEMGHAITQTTSSLVYQWESGAINEGFSDIWAACVTNYATIHKSVPGEITWRLFEKCDNQNQTDIGSRDMKDPTIFDNPSTHHSDFWEDATLRTCRDLENTDQCGVHNNSGVLNKWFYLITEGESDVNTEETPYSITGLGFGISQKIAYLTSINLPANASYATAKAVSIYAAAALYGSSSPEVQTVKDAWLAVGVDTSIFNMNNVLLFTTNNFTGVAVDKNGDIWAGTNYNGLYHYKGTHWEKRPEIPNVRINDIKADKAGNIWIAQSGTQGGGTQAQAGGVNYIKAPYAAGDASFYTIGANTDLPSRNARCIFVDTSRVNDAINPKVWVATLAYITSGNSTSGMLGQGIYSAGRKFINVSEGLNIASRTAGVLTVGGNKYEIWTFAQANNGINQLLVYNAGTNRLIDYYDHVTDPILPSGFLARSIYGDAKNRIWIATANNGLIVLDENQNWHHINNLSSSAYPPGTQPYFNSIAGSPEGNVYIGTNNGILVFDRGNGLIDKIDNPNNYRMFNKANGLPSNQINALAYDTSRYKLIVATDSGIVFYEPLCVAPYCKEYRTTANIESQTLSSGNWSDPAIWSNNKLPDSLTIVSIKNNIVIDVDARCKSLSVTPPGSITVNAGVKLTLFEEKADIIIGAQNAAGGRKPVKRVGGIGLQKIIDGNSRLIQAPALIRDSER